MSTSMRSPGPYGGRPDTKSRRRSSKRASSGTPNSLVTSVSSVPGGCTRYGRRRRSLGSRSDAFSAFFRSADGKRRLQAAEHVPPEFLGLERDRVGAERQDPRCEALAGPVRDGDLHPAVGTLLQDLGPLQTLRGPPGDLGREGDARSLLRLAGTPRAHLYVVGRAEAPGRDAPPPYLPH